MLSTESLEHGAGFADQLIAHRMPKRVVDLFEAVEVNYEYRDLTRRLISQLVGVGIESPSITEPRERVEGGEPEPLDRRRSRQFRGLLLF